MNDFIPRSDETPHASSRRAFIAHTAAIGMVPAVIGLLLKAQRRASAPEAAGPPSAPAHRLDQFLPLVGTRFTTAGQPALELTLARAEALKRHQPEVAEQFSLRFSAPAGQPFESRLHELHHPALGKLELFISPVGSAGQLGGQQVGEAVINCTRAKT